LHADVLAAFGEMRRVAAQHGIDLVAASSYRDFQRQAHIWNAKFRGERPLLDGDGNVLKRETMGTDATIDAILRWSALPGASRHHWGTDLDVIDRAALPGGYQARLVPQEFVPGAVFGHLEAWLSANAADFGFFRPYRVDRGGVQPEPWHLSWSPIAIAALEALSVDALRDALANSSIEARDRVLERLPELHERFVLAVDQP
jgi:LAS superfamily LD-carboxypeptidase LdcB